MRKILILLGLLLSVHFHGRADLSLDYCLERAKENYPELKKYGLIDRAVELNLQEINRSWLPQVTISAQGTVQNKVPAFPTILRDMLAQNRLELKGMSKIQYKLAADLNQTIWDGGASKANRAIARAANEESRAAIDVEMYAIRSQVENLFFATLLVEEQIKQSQSTLSLLEANLKRIDSMVKNGTAMQSDADMIEAQLLTLKQNISEARSAADGYRSLLAIYIGEEIGMMQLECPSPQMPASNDSQRPELSLFEKRIEHNLARENAIKASLMPRFSFFAQAYYGYPGLNYFESMASRSLSFNILTGVRIAWNIESLYTKDIKRKTLQINSAMANTDRDIFLYNTKLQTSREEAAIKGIQDVIKEDERIVELRRSVRLSAESQLENGIIDATALLSKINDENQARLNSAYHKIQLVQNIYQLKNILNR